MESVFRNKFFDLCSVLRAVDNLFPIAVCNIPIFFGASANCFFGQFPDLFTGNGGADVMKMVSSGVSTLLTQKNRVMELIRIQVYYNGSVISAVKIIGDK